MATLEDKAQEFASELTATMQGVLGNGCPDFVAEASPLSTGAAQRVAVHTVNSEVIPLAIEGDHCLS